MTTHLMLVNSSRSFTALPASPLPLKSWLRGATLPLLSENVWRIHSGIVRILTWNSEGEQVILGIWGSGDVIGLPLLTSRFVIAECVTTVEAIEMPAGSHLYESLLEYAQRSQEFVRILQHRRTYPRLLHLLIWLSQRFGIQVGQNYVLKIPFTHQELSDCIGITRVTVTRLLQDFERDGILERLEGRQLILYLSQIQALDLFEVS